MIQEIKKILKQRIKELENASKQKTNAEITKNQLKGRSYELRMILKKIEELTT